VSGGRVVGKGRKGAKPALSLAWAGGWLWAGGRWRMGPGAAQCSPGLAGAAAGPSRSRWEGFLLLDLAPRGVARLPPSFAVLVARARGELVVGLLLLLLDFVRPVYAVCCILASAFGSWPSFPPF
jgi:hypothetical protein